MSKKSDKQLKELRRLMPWNWDSRVEEHPPGEKAMHDFENVVNNQYDVTRPRHASKAPLPPARKTQPAAKDKPARQITIEPPAAIPPQGQPSGGRDSSNAAHAGNAAGPEREAPPSTARNTNAGADGSDASQSALKAAATPALALRRNPGCALPPTRAAPPAAGCPSEAVSTFDTSARRTGPGSHHHAALADGHFIPTPHPTPATVIGTAPGKAAAAAAAAAGFRSPQPRTVFAGKKRSNSDAAAAAPPGVRPATSTACQEKADTQQQQLLAASPEAALPELPTARTKGLRTTVARPHTFPIDLSFLGETPAKDAAPASPAAAAAAVAPPVAAAVAPAAAPRPPMDLARFGTGPVIRRPPSCPPLFKASRGARSASTTPHRAPGSSGKRSRQEFVGGFSPPAGAGLSPSLPPVAPSAWKQSQAAAAGAQLLQRERSLMQLVAGRALAPGASSAQVPAVQQQQQQQPVPLGPSLAWACAQLQQHA